MLGLLDDLDDLGAAVVTESGDTEPLGVRNFVQKHPGAGALLPEPLGNRGDAVADQVVPEDDAHGVAVNESLGQAQRLGDAAGALLVRVGETLEAECLAVAEQFEELARVRTTGHDHDLVDPSSLKALNGEIHHGPVIDR